MEMTNEQESKKDNGTAETAKAENPGDFGQRTPTLVEVNTAAERLERATAAQRAENDRAEKLYAMQRLGGMSGIGKQDEPPKVETAKEYADKVMRNQIK